MLVGIASRRSPKGKLREAARAWALARSGRTDDTRAVRPDDQVRRDAEALGVPAENLPDPDDEEETEVFQVWDINWPSMALFLDCSSQWRAIASMAGVFWLGIDYAAAKALLDARPRRAARRHPAHRLLADLRVMEAAAVEVMNEERP